MSDANTSSSVPSAVLPSPHTGETFAHLALDALRPSPTKVQAERRARFDAKALKELSATVKEVGVLEPILVRVIETDPAIVYEIVAGERRWCAAKAAGLATIPSMIRVLSDDQVLCLQLIENLQREALHALDEAEGFGTLLQQQGYTVERLAAEIAKPRAYVVQRLKLLALCPAARQAFNKGKLVLSTAFMLARVPTEDLQRQALKDITESREGCEPMSPRQAERHLHEHYMLRLADASFPTQDPGLIAAAGPCGSCPKRTGNQPELFKDVQGADVCTDRGCFRAKRQAHSERQLAAAKEAGRTIIDGAAAKKIAPYGVHHLEGHVRPSDRCYDDAKNRTYRELLGDVLEPALLVVPGTSEVVEVLDQKVLAPLLKERGVGAAKRKGNESERERRAQTQRESAFRWRLFQAVRQRSPATLARADLEQVAVTTFQHHGYESRKRLLKAWGWAGKNGKALDSLHHAEAARTHVPKLTDTELTRFLLDCVFVSDLYVSPWRDNDKAERLLAAAKRLRIDVDAIRKGCPSEATPKKAGGPKSVTPKKTKTAPHSTRKAV